MHSTLPGLHSTFLIPRAKISICATFNIPRSCSWMKHLRPVENHQVFLQRGAEHIIGHCTPYKDHPLRAQHPVGTRWSLLFTSFLCHTHKAKANERSSKGNSPSVENKSSQVAHGISHTLLTHTCMLIMRMGLPKAPQENLHLSLSPNSVGTALTGCASRVHNTVFMNTRRSRRTILNSCNCSSHKNSVGSLGIRKIYWTNAITQHLLT